MKYIRLSDEKYPITHKAIKMSNPLKSIPKGLNAEQLLSLGYAIVHATPRPVDSNVYKKPTTPPPGYKAPIEYDADTHKVQEGPPLQTAGVYNQVWDVLGLKNSELTENLKSAKEKQTQKLQGEFLKESNKNVVSNTVNWKGGYDSASRINNKTLLMEFNNDTKGTIYDIDDEPHEFTLAEIKQISYDIGKQYEDTYVSYQNKNKAIKNARNKKEVRKDYVW